MKLLARMSGHLALDGGTTTLRVAVAGHLRKLIISGELAPGTLLREISLAERLKVSATPVREALSQLASEGLIEIKANRQRQVTPLDHPAMIDLLEIQSVLLRIAHIRAFENFVGSDLTRLEQAVTLIKMGTQAVDPLIALGGMNKFNDVLLDCAGSAELVRLTLDRRALLARYLILNSSHLISKEWLGDYKKMMIAVRARRADDFVDGADRMHERIKASWSAGSGSRGRYPKRT